MIIYFSGNGNSRLVARELGRQLDQGVMEMLAFGADSVDIKREKLIVWVMPVHCWGMPVAVAKFIENLPASIFDSEAMHALVLTCGDDCGKTAESWRSAVHRKGLMTIGAWSVQMPNTYVLLPGFDVDSPELTARKLNAMPDRVSMIADEIRKGSAAISDVVQGSFARLKSSIYPLFARFDINPGKFRVDTDACIGCGRCYSACPLGNVTLSAERNPSWSDNCTMCLGCYNVCPVRAIDYGNRSKGKGQYYAPRSL